jgi:hypothetical protein
MPARVSNGFASSHAISVKGAALEAYSMRDAASGTMPVSHISHGSPPFFFGSISFGRRTIALPPIAPDRTANADGIPDGVPTVVCLIHLPGDFCRFDPCGKLIDGVARQVIRKRHLLIDGTFGS